MVLVSDFGDAGNGVDRRHRRGADRCNNGHRFAARSDVREDLTLKRRKSIRIAHRTRPERRSPDQRRAQSRLFQCVSACAPSHRYAARERRGRSCPVRESRDRAPRRSGERRKPRDGSRVVDGLVHDGGMPMSLPSHRITTDSSSAAAGDVRHSITFTSSVAESASAAIAAGAALVAKYAKNRG